MNLAVESMNRERVYQFLKDWVPEGAPQREMHGYIRQSAGRLVATAQQLDRAPRGSKLLEIGTIPYFLPLLMRNLRPDIDWTGTNWFGERTAEARPATARNAVTGESVQFKYIGYNVESTEPDPFEAGSFDVVTFCEVFEHLFTDPVQSLENLHRALRPGGHLLLTTPNPARAYNLQRWLLQESFYDPISAYGAYGRHNREYSRHELSELLENTGFDVLSATTVESSNDWLFRKALARVGYGEHHVLWARRRPGAARRYRPRWLYRSYDDSFYRGEP